MSLAAAHLAVPASTITVVDGVASSGSRRVRYGSLVDGQLLDLRIPFVGDPVAMDPESNWGVAGLDGLVVTGDPIVKDKRDYTVVGTSFPIPSSVDKVTGRTEWACDVTLPGMLQARMVRPPAMGATLVSVGTLDRQRFPRTQVVRTENLLAVASTDEWEAVGAAHALATTTRWTTWTGLPGSDALAELLRTRSWAPPDERRGDPSAVDEALAKAARTLTVHYEQPYVRHAPIGPFVAVADVRSDGVTVWAHSTHPQGLRAQIAHLLSLPIDRVVVRWRDHASEFGRSTHAGDGAAADAAILSQALGRPVRVQWTLQEDLEWSSVSPAWFSDATAGLDGTGRLIAVRSAFHSPHMFDARQIGALLAGLPTNTFKARNWVDTVWADDRIGARDEQVRAMPNLGAESAYGGLRGNIMRTPGQRQQNFVLESIINEAAAAAGVDPIRFRREHTTDERLVTLLEAVAAKADWQTRPSPSADARHDGQMPVRGRGVSVIIRQNARWVGVVEIEVTPATGVVRVIRFTIGVDCGKVINPRQLERCMASGVVMGLSKTLKEEVTFDRSCVTSTDWNRYQILTMAETPEIAVVQLSRVDAGFGGGSEAANALAAPAVTAAFFDATAVQPRRIPLTPSYVMRLLAS